MRVSIITESFLPHMNGVTRSVLEVVRHLESTGHEVMVIAPAAQGMPELVGRTRVRAVPSVPMPGYPSVKVAIATVSRIQDELVAFAPDVVHLASPFALGWQGVVAADRLGLPVVAIYQTDVAAYAARYGVAATHAVAQSHIARLHRRATLTLVPSSATHSDLQQLGIDRLRRWGRGVDTGQFGPEHRNQQWREHHAGDDLIIGYVGRLAAEKQVEDLRVLADIPGTRLVIVGDGPERERLATRLPEAVFLGRLDGHDLATALASFDIFVHPGESETFGQTLQEAHASGVPVVAPGSGGPIDLVRSSIDGWLYEPGNLGQLREQVLDLVGDDRKRRALGDAGRTAVAGRTWAAAVDDLLGRYAEAVHLHTVDSSTRRPRAVRAELAEVEPYRRRRSFIALGDSLTEGLCDPDTEGNLRGWADRLAVLLAERGGLDYANLAVRSRRVRDVRNDQLPTALALKPELVSLLIGSNDLVGARVDIAALADEVEAIVTQLRSNGSDVLLVTPFLPAAPVASIFARRFARFASHLQQIAARTGALLVDTDLTPGLPAREHFGDDLVHLSSRGHRLLAYRAAARLGIPDADALGGLDAMFHADDNMLSRGQWWMQHALPWAGRRIQGKTAGDGCLPKHTGYVRLGPSRRTRTDA